MRNTVPLWFAAVLAGWAVSATAAALVARRRGRQAGRDPVRLWLGPDGDATATAHIDQVLYW